MSVVIYVSPDSEELARLIEKDGKCIIVLDRASEDVPESSGNNIRLVPELEKKFIEEYNSMNEKGIEREMVEWFKRWPDEPVCKGKSFKELVAFRGTSLWWFAETMLYKDNIAGLPSFKDTVVRLEAMRMFLKEQGPDVRVRIMSGGLTGRAAGQVSLELGIPFTQKRTKKTSPDRVDERYARRIWRFKKYRLIIRHLLGKTLKGRYMGYRGSRMLVMSYFMSIRPGAVSGSGKKDYPLIPNDVMLYPVLEEITRALGGYPRILYIDRHYPVGWKSIKQLGGPAFPMDIYSAVLGRELRGHSRRFKKLWNEIKESEEFRSSLKFHGLDLWPFLKDYFAFLFLKQFPEAVESILAMENMLASEKPEVVIISNEAGFYGRALTAASRKRGIRTVGIQHGSIGENDVDYFMTGMKEKHGCPIPNVTGVWGARDRRLLLEVGHYPENSVEITGSPRYDYLARATEIYDRNKILSRFDVGEKKLVAVTTQPFPVVSERENWLKSIALAARNIDDAVFIVKPHPAESGRMHERICGKYGGDNIKIVKDVDTNELIFSSDLMITSHSTTGLESLILGTPLMIVNLTGQGDLMGYVTYGAARGAYRDRDIEPVIRQILEESQTDSARDSINRYIYDYAYKVDGMASKRIVEVASSLLGTGEN